MLVNLGWTRFGSLIELRWDGLNQLKENPVMYMVSGSKVCVSITVGMSEKA